MSGVQAMQVDSIDGAEPGAWKYFSTRDLKHAGILHTCPCGCGQISALHFEHAFSEPGRAKWRATGFPDKPTLSPSVLIHELSEAGEKVGTHWHGFLRSGVWEPVDDRNI